MSRRWSGEPGGRDINTWHSSEQPPRDGGCMRWFMAMTFVTVVALALVVWGVLS